MKKYLLILLTALFLSFQSQASIEYRLRYNTVTNMFDVFLVSTTAYATANVGPSQATVVFDPAFNTEGLLPASVILLNGGAWVPQDKVTGNTGSLNTKEVVGFQTTGAPIVGGIAAGTEYLLFSFTFGANAQNCIGTFRLLINASDPTDPNGAGGDFASYLNINGTDEFSTNSDATFLSCAAGPVPVLFLSFTATKSGDDALLSWNVSNESSLTKYYIIERSTDKINFTPVETILAKNNGIINNSYNLTDIKLSTLRSSGVIYYRIKQVDADGKTIYSEIKTVRLSGKNFGVRVSPNPAKTHTIATIDLEEASPIIINVTDIAGKRIKQIKMGGVKGENVKKVDLTGLATGSYMLKVFSGEQSQTVALVKTQ